MISPGKYLIVAIPRPDPAPQECRLLALAETMGVPTKVLVLGENKPFLQRLIEEFGPGPPSVAMSAEALAAIAQDRDSGAGLQSLRDGTLPALLVFGFTGAAEQQSALLSLTYGAVIGVSPLSGQAERFSLPRATASMSRQLAGLSFSGSHEEPVFTFELGSRGENADVILTANERPIFVRLKLGPVHLFLLAATLPDVDMPLNREHGIEEHYATLVAPLIYLRTCFQDFCWHAVQNTARLIIDDPLLTPSYGFLNYRKLQKSMQRFRYGTSIAFIPWNGWRTRRRNASQLLDRSSNLSICVHGCDHTNREFNGQAPTVLDAKAGLAMQRMEAQQNRTGAPFEPVMVFPQGIFSASAIRSLRANGYLAAVNSTLFPTDQHPGDITIADCLRPALTRYDGFPIFERHYPGSIFDFAFDLFLGKPVLVVEHHPFFRQGCEAIEALVADLYKVEPSLSWPLLSDQLTHCCLHRKLPDGSTEVLFFTRRFQLKNGTERPEHFRLRKYEPDADAISTASLDGVSVPYRIGGGFLQLEVEAQPGQERTVEIGYKGQTRLKAGGFGAVYNARVALRRGLSEFRDNILARNDGLLKVASQIVNALKVTGKS